MVKTTQPSPATQIFSFGGNGSIGPFNLGTSPATAGIPNNMIFGNLEAETIYAVNETVPQGWQLNCITCTIDTSGLSGCGWTMNAPVVDLANDVVYVNFTPWKTRGQTLLLAAGNASCTFNNIALGNIQGTKFNDFNGNGLRDGGDSGVPGATINLYGSTHTTLLARTTTNSTGGYSFTHLFAGTYQVSEVVPSRDLSTESQVKTAGQENCYTAVVVSGGRTTSNIDFGNFVLAKISGFKSNDINGNGVFDNGEPLLSGWNITFWTNGGTTKVASQLTDSSGFFNFTGLTAGTCTLTEVQQAGWINKVSPGSIVVISCTNSVNNAFGNRQPSFSQVTDTS